ncbi:MAG: YafY family transcriptional regulator [Anaerolineae bacterium]|jgi:predicted DNA-binding transcriptional regulator YafY|nr:YafY family transcriptional regulator [Anaerolineae bacterium]
MNRIDRLFATLLLLYARRRVRAEELAERFAVTERTVYRDMKSLIEAGVPVVSMPGIGYGLVEGFQLPPLALSPNEAVALTIGARMFLQQATGSIYRDAETALQKVENVLPPSVKNNAQTLAASIDFIAPQNRLDFDQPTVRALVSATLNRRVVRLRYRDREGWASEREIEPMRLSYSDGGWYISAYCRLRAGLRSFRLSRIEQAEVSAESFTPRLFLPSPLPQQHTIHIRFAPGADVRATERPHYGFVRIEAGDIWVYQVNQFEEIIPWVMAFGAQAEVISPPDLRAHLRAEAQKLINLLT